MPQGMFCGAAGMCCASTLGETYTPERERLAQGRAEAIHSVSGLLLLLATDKVCNPQDPLFTNRAPMFPQRYVALQTNASAACLRLFMRKSRTCSNPVHSFFISQPGSYQYTEIKSKHVRGIGKTAGGLLNATRDKTTTTSAPRTDGITLT